MWYREALRLSPLEARDHALVNLVLLMRADGGRLHEAVDLIIRCAANNANVFTDLSNRSIPNFENVCARVENLARSAQMAIELLTVPAFATPTCRETSTLPLRQGGAVIATLSLLQPRPAHRQAFRKLGEGEGWSQRFGRPSVELWEEARRLRELYPQSINNLVVFLGILDGLGGIFEILKVSGRRVKASRVWSEERSSKMCVTVDLPSQAYTFNASLLPCPILLRCASCRR